MTYIKKQKGQGQYKILFINIYLAIVIISYYKRISTTTIEY